LFLIKAIIHPIWVIDEYAIIVRKWLWFNPINPPVNAFILARIIIIFVDVFIKKNDIIDNGAIFCQVDKIKAGIHEMEVITEGYHKWHGAIPILIKREKSRIRFILIKIWLDSQSDNLLIIRSLDPKAWINKYFTDASVSWNE
jgi:hypothetical protein